MARPTVEEIDRITPQEVKDMLKGGEDLVVVDVRSEESFREGHIPGSISIPKEKLHERFEVMSPDQKVVFY